MNDSTAKQQPKAKGLRKSRTQSPIIRLGQLLLKVYKQPFGLPTPEQSPEMKRLAEEIPPLLEYRRTHPDWRTNRDLH